jgi:peptidoglycan/xylan/chitin deacetylase (PgdA/CDA1 family)
MLRNLSMDKLRHNLILLAALFVLAGASLTACRAEPDITNQKTIYVGQNLVDCVGVAPQQCLLIKENPDDDWSLFYDQIEDFDFEEGYEYELIVEVEVIDEPPQDGSMLRTSLVEIVSKTEVIQPSTDRPIGRAGLPILTWEAIKNAAYPNKWSSNSAAQLVDGEYRQKDSMDSADALYIGLAPYRIYGDLDGDSLEDALVVLVAVPGVSDPLYNLVAVLNKGGTPYPMAPIPLGERISIRSIAIPDGEVVVDIDVFAPDDPACCPSQSKRLIFKYAGKDLELVEETGLPSAQVSGNLDVSPQRIFSKPGPKSATFKRQIVFNEIDSFVVRALAGQRMDVKVDSLNENVLLSITGEEDGAVLASINAELTNWSGEIPTTQDYTIQAVSVGSGTEYDFGITIKGAGGRTRMIPPEPYLIPSMNGTVAVRSGPGTGYEVIGHLDSGEAIHITGRNLGVTPETRWWRVCCFRGQEGWVRDDYGEVVGSTDDLPVPETSLDSTPEPIVPVAPPSTSSDKILYLTFDDGPSSPLWTPQILEELERYNARAAFFVLGEDAGSNPELIQNMVESGHTVAIHTSSYFTLAGESRARFFEEVVSASETLGTAGGGCLRPPVGALDSFTRARAAELGFAIVLWDIDAQDWRLDDPDEIANQVLEQVYPGAYILMQGGGGDRSATVTALAVLLEELSAQGYQFAPFCRE